MEWSDEQLRGIIESELVAFPGVTITMLNQRLKNRIRKSITYVIKQMIEDGEIVYAWKHVGGVVNPVRVIYLPGQVPKLDISMVDSSTEDYR